MKKLVLTGPGQLEYKELSLSPLKDKQVKVRTLYTAISQGTELRIYRGECVDYFHSFDPHMRVFQREDKQWEYPVDMGYQAVGIVEKVGGSVSEIRPGDLVMSAYPHQTQAILNEEKAVKIPDGVDPTNAVVFPLLRVAYNAILASRYVLGEKVAVFGMGTIGLLVVNLLKMSGAKEIYAVDRFENRLELAKQLGASQEIIVSRETSPGKIIKEKTCGKGVDVAIECSGNAAALNEAIRSVSFQCPVVAVGLYNDPGKVLDLSREFHMNVVQLICCQAQGLPHDLRKSWDLNRREEEMSRLLPELNISPIIGPIVPFEEAINVYESLDRGDVHYLCTLFTY